MIELPSTGAIARIQAIVAESYGLHPSIMRTSDKRMDVARPRQRAMWIARKITGRSFNCIGRQFGGLDHSTVFYSVAAVGKRMAKDPLERADMEALLAASRRELGE